MPLFFLLFLPPDANGVRSTRDRSSPTSSPMPGGAAVEGRGRAHRQGLHGAAALGDRLDGRRGGRARSAIEVARIVTKGRFPLSAVAIGLGVVLPPESTLRACGSARWSSGAWAAATATPGTQGHEIWVEGCEPICAGLISGAALMGIGNAIVNVLI